jgi:hypothetical protein
MASIDFRYPYILNPDKREEQIEELFQYWKDNGYPNYDKSYYDLDKELHSIIMFDERSILKGKDLIQTMHGLGFLWTYFPHWVDIKCGADKSVADNWNDEDKLRTLIEKTYDWELKHGNGTFTINRLRQNAKVYCSKQSVSNFRPTVAKYIYNTYGNRGTVWDMSCGFGGRLLGFIASDCKKYIGTDPSTNTYNGLLEMKNDFAHTDKEIELYCLGSEVFRPNEGSVDLCFTSPPYFDTERYSDEETQSYIKFPTKDEWVSGFLYSTIENCKYALKDNGYLIINIANVKSCDELESSTVRIAEELGFTLLDTLYLILSSISGKGIKREPVFIFKKTIR